MNVKKYLQVRQGILNLIARREIKTGQELPSEKDLAKIFKVSVITVRRALQGLEEGNIVRREHGRGTFLNAEIKNSEQMGTVIFVGIQSYSSFPIVTEILREALEKRGHRLKSFVVGPVPDNVIMPELAGCNGILVSGRVNRGWLDFLVNTGLPVTCIGSNPVKNMVSEVKFNWRLATSRMVDYMVSLGHRNIALFAGDSKYVPSGEMCQGYRESLQRNGLSYLKEHVACLETNRREQQIIQFFAQRREIDAIIVEAGNLVHFLLLQRIADMAITDIGILSESRILEKPMTSTVEAWFPDNIFERGVEMLCESIENQQRGIKVEMLKPRLMFPPDTQDEFCKMQSDHGSNVQDALIIQNEDSGIL